MLNIIKHHLSESIQSIASQKEKYLSNPETDFTRNRQLSFETVMRTILSMGGKSLAKELLDVPLTVSNSAFVQRRYAIKSSAFHELFRYFTAKIPQPDKMPILAVDGSDICIPRNANDFATFLPQPFLSLIEAMKATTSWLTVKNKTGFT